MPELNNMLDSIQKKTSEIEKSVKDLLSGYNDLFREGARTLNAERSASNGNMEGLEDFYRLMQIIRRNRDVVGSVSLGIKNIKTMDKFKFVEEDVPKTKKSTKTPPKTGATVRTPHPEGPSMDLQNIQIPETGMVTNG